MSCIISGKPRDFSIGEKISHLVIFQRWSFLRQMQISFAEISSLLTRQVPNQTRIVHDGPWRKRLRARSSLFARGSRDLREKRDEGGGLKAEYPEFRPSAFGLRTSAFAPHLPRGITGQRVRRHCPTMPRTRIRGLSILSRTGH